MRVVQMNAFTKGKLGRKLAFVLHVWKQLAGNSVCAGFTCASVVQSVS